MAGRLADQHGGIAGLVELIEQHSEAVEYDLITHGLRLRDLGTTFTWRDLLVIMKRQPRGSALSREVDPTGWTDTWDTLVLEQIHDAIIALTMYHGNQTKVSKSKIPRGALRKARTNPVQGRARKSKQGMSREEIDARMNRQN